MLQFSNIFLKQKFNKIQNPQKDNKKALYLIAESGNH
jgi:hypothetical protein